jgi:hypothetical protein
MSENKNVPVPAKAVIHGDLPQIVGRPWTRAIFWFVVLAAGGIDIATFYQVLVLVLDAPQAVVWVAVVGFVAVGLTLAHYAGLQIREAMSPRNVTGSTTLAWVFGGVWLLLGVVAFVVRFGIAQTMGSDTSSFSVDGVAQTTGSAIDATSQHATALLFLVFYIATGTVTALAGGYFRQNPNARQFGRAVEQRSSAVRRHASNAKRFGTVLQVAQALSDARTRQDEAWAVVQQQCESAANRLKQETRLRIVASETTGQPPSIGCNPVGAATTAVLSEVAEQPTPAGQAPQAEQTPPVTQPSSTMPEPPATPEPDHEEPLP